MLRVLVGSAIGLNDLGIGCGPPRGVHIEQTSLPPLVKRKFGLRL